MTSSVPAHTTPPPGTTAWRDEDPERFAATVTVAADQLGVQPLAVEKDYWVCRALRAITHAYPGQVIFKGGTSLEKLRIIQRFSEDLDLLVIGTYPTDREAKRALKGMCQKAASAVGSIESGAKSGGTAGGFHRQAWINPPLTQAAIPGLADPAAVLVELGQSGGKSPHYRRDRDLASRPTTCRSPGLRLLRLG